MKDMILKRYLIQSLAALFITVNLFSAEVEGIVFNDEYLLTGEKLQIRGYSVLNYMLVIKAYAGALYLRSQTTPDQALSDIPRILELYYFHKISAQDFRDSTTEMIKKNTSPDEFSGIKSQLDQFNGLYRDVNPGDRYRAEYIPGKGTTLYLNGRALGSINGREFSRAFFSIWIGKNPIDKKFRDQLLRKK
jgi:hypothetical protein